MSIGKNIRLFRLTTGEMVITEIKETDDEGKYMLDYPATIVPIPPQQAGGQQNQIGFGKMMPFSDYAEDIALNPKVCVAVDSVPDKRLIATYEQWVQQMRSQEGRIIVPTMNQQNIPKDGAKADFSKLNV